MDPSNIPSWYRDEDRSGPLRDVAIAFLVVESCFLVLFLVSRSVNNTLKGLDLWLILLGYVWSASLCVLSLLFVNLAGAGRHALVVLAEDPNKLVIFLKLELAGQYAWVFGVALPKLAILCLYLQIFVKRAYRKATQILFFIISLNLLAWILVTSTVCQPFAYNWDKSIPGGTCHNLYLMFKLASLPNIATDVGVLVLPIPIIWSLQTNLARKVGLTITFVTGGFAIVTAVLRFYTFFAVDLFADPTFNSVATLAWTIIEPGCYLLAAIMLNLRPLWRYMKKSEAFSLLRSHTKSRTGFRITGSDHITLSTDERKPSNATQSDISQYENMHNQITVTHAYDVRSQSRLDSPC